MLNIKLVIFDMDGLLFDTERIAYRVFKDTMAKYNYNFTMDIYKNMIGLRPEDDEILLKEIYGEDIPLGKIKKEYSQNFNQVINTEGVPVKAGALQLLDELDRQKIKRCIASSSPRSAIEKYVKINNLQGRFDFFLSGEEVAEGKPHPDIFLKACSLAGVKTEEAIVLEDSFNGFLSAYRANIRCILIPDMAEPNGKMRAHAYKIVNNLHDVAELIEMEK